MRLLPHQNMDEDYARARKLRNEASPMEKKLWGVLSPNAATRGIKFRRQQAVHPYIADFACLAVHVLVELDGDSHDGQQAYDAQRDAYLRSQGYDVLRFSNENVKMNVEGVVATILDFVELKSKKLGIAIAAPLPNPPREEEGTARGMRRSKALKMNAVILKNNVSIKTDQVPSPSRGGLGRGDIRAHLSEQEENRTKNARN